MVKVATIVPTSLLSINVSDTFHMALAQNIGVPGNAASKAYTNFFRSMVAADDFVLMDNGAAEGEQPTAEQLVPKIKLLHPTEIILPDTIYDKDITIRKGREAIKVFKNEGIFQHVKHVMAVPQGADFEQWKQCVDEMLSWGITTLGVSKFICPRYCDDYLPSDRVRYEACCYIRERDSNVQIHLLGCWADPREIGYVAQQAPLHIRSADSAIAYVYTRAGKALDPSKTIRPQGDITFLDDVHSNTPAVDLKLLEDNKRRWRDLCNGTM